MKDELGGNIIEIIVAQGPKTYLTDDRFDGKKAKGRKKRVMKWEIKI